MTSMMYQAPSLPTRKYKYSLHGPSLLCVALCLLCVAWLLGYGLAQWNGISMKSKTHSTNGPASLRELPSWRGEPMTKNADYGR